MLTLHLQQASLQRTDDAHGETLPDLETILGRRAHVVGFTEAQGFHPELTAAARRHGYRLLLPSDGDTAMAVRGDVLVRGHAVRRVSPARPNRPGQPGHVARNILTAQLVADEELVSVSEAHWTTRKGDAGGERLAMTQAMAEVVAQEAAGSRLGFWLGDTNSDDRPQPHGVVDGALKAGQLTSCWDELGRWPATHGRQTLDVVGSYDPDHRVTCKRAKVWHQLHSDHRQVSAFYAVRPRRKV